MATVTDEYRDLDSLRPHIRNYNRHGEQAVASLADAIRLTAYTAPFVVKPDGTILGGHARRLALLKLRAEAYPEPEGVRPGWVVPCRVVECNAVDERRILVTDNPDPAQIDYDGEALASLLTELEAEGALAGTWYSPAGLEALIGELAGETAEPAGPRDLSDRISEQWMVVIDCADEAQQRDLLERFEREGLTCRALMS